MAERVVLHAEDLDAAVEEALEFARERGEAIRGAHPDRVYTTREDKPDVTAALGEALRAALEDEIVSAVETDEGTGILEWEYEREVIKKALVGLKRVELKNIAREKKLEIQGSTEQLAATIGRAYRWDEEEIARLILSREPEATPERGHMARLVPVADPIDPDFVARRLEYVHHRYVRVGVARWFIFEEISRDNDVVVARGRIRSYQAHVTEEIENPTLGATRSEDQIAIRLEGGARLIQMTARNPTAVRSAMKAIEHATGISALGYVPFRQPALEGAAGTFAGESLFLLDVLDNRISEAGFRSRNLTIARFRLSEADELVSGAALEEAPSRPQLKAVRFEGDHILDSVTACHLLAQEARALVDISFTASLFDATQSTRESLPRFPLRVGLERDHAVVLTGFGTLAPELSVAAHVALRAAVIAEISDGISDTAKIEDLSDRIRERSREEEDVNAADMLPDDTPDGQ